MSRTSTRSPPYRSLRRSNRRLSRVAPQEAPWRTVSSNLVAVDSHSDINFICHAPLRVTFSGHRTRARADRRSRFARFSTHATGRPISARKTTLARHVPRPTSVVPDPKAPAPDARACGARPTARNRIPKITNRTAELRLLLRDGGRHSRVVAASADAARRMTEWLRSGFMHLEWF